MNTTILVFLFLISIITISILLIRKTTAYKTYIKKKEANQASKIIIHDFTKNEDYNLSEMIKYHKKNGSPKYEI